MEQEVTRKQIDILLTRGCNVCGCALSKIVNLKSPEEIGFKCPNCYKVYIIKK